MGSADIVFTFLSALFLYLVFEAPISGLQKVFILPLLMKGKVNRDIKLIDVELSGFYIRSSET